MVMKHQINVFVLSPRASLRESLDYEYPAGKRPFGDSPTRNANSTQLRKTLWGVVNAHMGDHLALVLGKQVEEVLWKSVN